jgi:hypothetical protein
LGQEHVEGLRELPGDARPGLGQLDEHTAGLSGVHEGFLPIGQVGIGPYKVESLLIEGSNGGGDVGDLERDVM